MKYYFHKNKVVQLEHVPEWVLQNQSENFDDRNIKYIPLTDAQVEFYTANKTARVQDIFKCELTVVAPVVIPAWKTRSELYSSKLCIPSHENEAVLISCDAAFDLYLRYNAENKADLASYYFTAYQEQKQVIKTENPD